jgi:hypothetical protein
VVCFSLERLYNFLVDNMWILQESKQNLDLKELVIKRNMFHPIGILRRVQLKEKPK